jgi:hypothetical protein
MNPHKTRIVFQVGDDSPGSTDSYTKLGVDAETTLENGDVVLRGSGAEGRGDSVTKAALDWIRARLS